MMLQADFQWPMNEGCSHALSTALGGTATLPRWHSTCFSLYKCYVTLCE